MLELIAAIIVQILVVGLLFRWMFRKDRRLRELHGPDYSRRRSGILHR